MNGDGVKQGYETWTGAGPAPKRLDACNPDTDGDVMDDGWEYRLF